MTFGYHGVHDAAGEGRQNVARQQVDSSTVQSGKVVPEASQGEGLVSYSSDHPFGLPEPAAS